MTHPPRLLIIDPSVVWPEEEGVAQILGDWRGTWRVARPGLTPGDGPGPGAGYDWDGVVVMGSRASVHEDLPWMRDLGSWLQPILEGANPLPVLGICFGHQLIAHRVGAEIGFVNPDRSEEKGIQETIFERSRLVPDGQKMRVIASHVEEVRAVPAGYRVVARRSHVPVDALEHERLPIFTVQFHPEAREEFLERRGLDPTSLDCRAKEDTSRLLASFRRVVLDQAGRVPRN